MENQPQDQKSIYDVKRQERELTIRRALQKKKIKKIIILSLVFASIGLLIKYAIQASREASQIRSENEAVTEVQGQYFKSQGRDHIAKDAEHPAYNSNPPTSGWHFANPHKTGVFTEEIEDGTLIHNLEHGHIWISYKPDLDPIVIQQLKDIAYRFRSKIIMAPRTKNDSSIVINAWEYQLKLDSYNEQQILGFIKAHRGKGPEDIPDAGF